jgi:hypothetical protein
LRRSGLPCESLPGSVVDAVLSGEQMASGHLGVAGIAPDAPALGPILLVSMLLTIDFRAVTLSVERAGLLRRSVRHSMS